MGAFAAVTCLLDLIASSWATPRPRSNRIPARTKGPLRSINVPPPPAPGMAQNNPRHCGLYVRSAEPCLRTRAGRTFLRRLHQFLFEGRTINANTGHSAVNPKRAVLTSLSLAARGTTPQISAGRDGHSLPVTSMCVRRLSLRNRLTKSSRKATRARRIAIISNGLKYNT